MASMEKMSTSNHAPIKSRQKTIFLVTLIKAIGKGFLFKLKIISIHLLNNTFSLKLGKESIIYSNNSLFMFD